MKRTNLKKRAVEWEYVSNTKKERHIRESNGNINSNNNNEKQWKWRKIKKNE